MSRNERLIIISVLFIISVMTSIDLITDAEEGVAWWHVLTEGLVILVALVGVFWLMKGTFSLKHSLEDQKKISVKLQEESNKWREHSKKYLEGLSQSIDIQLSEWDLTKSEKEVAFLLLKGFSLKEISEIRKTSEKTSRAQSASIYAKAGLNGRSQLSAFFLEDLLLPNE